MKYVKAIFENEDIQQLTVTNEDLINLATETLLAHNIVVESNIYTNLEDYLIEDDIAATYESIRNVVLEENLSFINLSSQIIGSNLPLEDKVLYFMEIQENDKSPENKSFASRHKGKLIAAGALAAAAGAGYAGYKGHLGAAAQEKIGKGLAALGKITTQGSKKAGLKSGVSFGQKLMKKGVEAEASGFNSNPQVMKDRASMDTFNKSIQDYNANKLSAKASNAAKDVSAKASNAAKDVSEKAGNAVHRANAWFAKRKQISDAKEAAKHMTPAQLDDLNKLRSKTGLPPMPAQG